MLNKNVADYTDFSGKTNKKIVQAPGGNSSIAFFWGHMNQNNSSEISKNTPNYNQSSVNTYSQVYANPRNGNVKYGGANGYGNNINNPKNNQDIKILQRQQIDKYSNPHLINSSDQQTGSMIHNNQSRNKISEHQAGNYSNYRNNDHHNNSRANQRHQISKPVHNIQNQYDIYNRPSTYQKKANLLSEQNQYSNKNYSHNTIKNAQNKQRIEKKSEVFHYHSQQPYAATNNPEYEEQQNIYNKTKFTQNKGSVHNHKNLISAKKSDYTAIQNLSHQLQGKKIKSSSLIYQNSEQKKSFDNVKNNLSRQYSRPYPVEIKAKNSIQKTVNKLDQIDIAIKQQNSRKYPPNIHSHPNHNRDNNIAKRISPKKLKNVQQTKHDSPQSKPCIRMTGIMPKNHLIFGDPSYNYWKESSNRQQSTQNNEETFGKRIGTRNIGDRNLVQPRYPGGKQTFKFE